jgi:hypothetical protein
MLSQILLVFAFVFAVIAALFVQSYPFAQPAPARFPWGVHFGWLAVAFWILSILLGGWVK